MRFLLMPFLILHQLFTVDSCGFAKFAALHISNVDPFSQAVFFTAFLAWLGLLSRLQMNCNIQIDSGINCTMSCLIASGYYLQNVIMHKRLSYLVVAT